MAQSTSLAQQAATANVGTSGDIMASYGPGTGYEGADAPKAPGPRWGGAAPWETPAAHAAAVGGSMIAALGALQAGSGQAAVAGYDADAERLNARIRGAQSAIEQGQVADKASDILARQTAVSGASGFAGGGSASDVAAQSAIAAGRDRLITAYAGAIARARSLNAARFDKYQADQAETSGMLNATTTLLGGASRWSTATGGL